MNYDKNFYINYREYLKIPEVKSSHTNIFRLFDEIVGLADQVVDLGCATCEYGQYLKSEGSVHYIGIDLQIVNLDSEIKVIQGNYLDEAFDAIYSESKVFVSLFSTEINYSTKERYKLYDRFFEKFPNIKCGMVSGFFYKKASNEEKYKEVVGHEVYQSVDKQTIHKDYYELRMHNEVPPGFFKDEFVEVWKFFIRK
jgi:hypothetical protein